MIDANPEAALGYDRARAGGKSAPVFIEK